MTDWLLLAVGAGIALTVLAVLAGAARWRNLERRVEGLERRANPASKHDWKYLERQDLGEAALMELASMRAAAEELTVRLDHASRRYQHVARGGHPDDPPSKWTNGNKE